MKNNDIFLDFNFVENKINNKNQHLFRITKDEIAFKKLKEQNDFIDIFREKFNNKNFLHISIKNGNQNKYISFSLKKKIENFQ